LSGGFVRSKLLLSETLLFSIAETKANERLVCDTLRERWAQRT
jgi:hypothetical protein